MPEQSRFVSRYSPLLLVLSLVVVLTVTAILLPIEIRYLWRWGVELAGHPVALVGVVLVMAALMSLGLPGSLCFWLIAPFHAPLLSVSMVLVGSVAGAMGAYHFGKGLGDTWKPGYLARQVLNLLGKRSDFLTQCAVRILPGFPHAFVNLAGGVLGLPLLVFCCAAIVGLTIKWTVYANAVHGMVSARQAEQAMDFFTLLPLIILALLLALGGLAKRWLLGQSKVDSLPPG
jgi:uncharacterized membrane protein YdjX (TVP38/TMEM64 family)